MSDRFALVDANVATMDDAGYGLIEDGAIVISGATVEWVGARSGLPDGVTTRSLSHRLVTPGLVDCHTHLVFGGDRSDELGRRLGGAGYEEIASTGGGIRSTVRATRAAGAAELLAGAADRLHRLHRNGATTVEVKSGYGLDLPTELEMLRIGRELDRRGPVTVTTTLLAAHVVPAEWRGDADGYVDLVVDTILPAAHAEGLVDAVDAFCEPMAFSPEQVDHVFTAAAGLGLPVTLHAAQLSENEGVDVAARHRARSADHLEHATETQVTALAEAGTVAVLIPGATHTLRQGRRPPVETLRRLGVPMALATDLNPGTSPVGDLALVANLGTLLHGLTPVEALAGVTRHAAAALGMDDRGVLAPGRRADLAVWDATHPDQIPYWMGMGLCSAVWVAGVESFDRVAAPGPGPGGLP